MNKEWPKEAWRPQVYGPTKFTPGFEDKPSPLEKLKAALERDFPHYTIQKGWKLGGVFRDGNEYQGLCFNPHLGCWFHLTWDVSGKCKTGGCSDGHWDLVSAFAQK